MPAAYDIASVSKSSLEAQAGRVARIAEAAVAAASGLLKSPAVFNPTTGAHAALSFPSERQIAQMLKGNRDALAAKSRAWQHFKQENGPDADFETFEKWFNETYDPRVYRFVHMTPAERNELFWSLAPDERGQLQSAIQLAEQRGYIRAGT